MAIEKRERKSTGRRKAYSYRVKWRLNGTGAQQGRTLDTEAEAIQLEEALRKSGWAYSKDDPEVRYLTLIGRELLPEEQPGEAPVAPTLYQATHRWANRPGLSKGSKINYGYVVEDRLGDLAHVPIDQLTALDLENWLNTQLDNYAPATAFISRVVVAGALRMHKIDPDLIGALPRIDPARRVTPIFLERDQVDALVKNAAKIGPRWAAQVDLTGSLGPRWGESCGLQKIHLSLDKVETSHIWIRQAVKQRGTLREGYRPEKVKTKNAVRMLPLNARLAEVMSEATLPDRDSRDLVFRPEAAHRTRATFWYYDAFTYAWQRLKASTPEVPDELRWHDLRHTAAKNLLEDGVPIAYVSKMLGHSKVEVTIKEYGSFDQRSHDLVRSLMA
jgi:integrase